MSKYISYYANDKEVCEGIVFKRGRWRHIKKFIAGAATNLRIPTEADLKKYPKSKAVCDIQTFAKKHMIAEGEYILKKENGDIWVATPGFMKQQKYFRF